MSELMDAFRDLVDANDDRSDCFLEITARAPGHPAGRLAHHHGVAAFADAHEITIVRPVARLEIEAYDLDQRLIDRLSTTIAASSFPVGPVQERPRWPKPSPATSTATSVRW